jgi:6-phosphogluconolactonase
MTAIHHVPFDTPAALTEAAVALLTEAFQQSQSSPYVLILSGGRTPLPAYQRIAEDGGKLALNPNLHIAFADERHVPDDSPDSNYANMRPMLEALQLPFERILRVQTNGFSLIDAAAQYDADLRYFFRSGGIVPLALLGLGPDGHTCSLFTPNDVDAGADRCAIPVQRPTPPHRVSITPGVLQRAERVIFLVSGADKNDIVQRLLEAPETVTAGRAVAACTRVEVWQETSLQ